MVILFGDNLIGSSIEVAGSHSYVKSEIESVLDRIVEMLN